MTRSMCNTHLPVSISYPFLTSLEKYYHFPRRPELLKSRGLSSSRRKRGCNRQTVLMTWQMKKVKTGELQSSSDVKYRSFYVHQFGKCFQAENEPLDLESSWHFKKRVSVKLLLSFRANNYVQQNYYSLKLVCRIEEIALRPQFGYFTPSHNKKISVLSYSTGDTGIISFCQ